MKFTIKKRVLQEALQSMGKATPARSTVPILNSVLFTASEDKLVCRATDLEITEVISVDAAVERAGCVAIRQRMLMEITNAMPEADIQIAVEEDNRVNISTQFGDYDIVGSSEEEFPKLPEVDNKKEVVIRGETLKRLINKTTFALSSDELKPALMGALFQFGDDTVTTVATDGHRLSVCSRRDYESKGYLGDVIVPRKFLQLLAQELDDEGEIVLWVGENHLTVSLGDLTIFSRIIDERYPDYASVLPEETDKTVKANREKLLGAVRRVAIFSNRSTRQITLQLSSGGSSITTEDPETSSSAREDLDLEYSGDDIVIAYNASYLSEILSHLDTDDVVLKLKTPISAGLILPDVQAENEQITMLLMPMRTSG